MKNYSVQKLPVYTGEVLAYRETGQGEVLLLLHGNMSSSVHWEPAMEILGKEFRVIAPDLRGFGDSTYSRPGRTLLSYAKDIIAFIEAMDLHNIHLVGWSAGGGVAMEIAASYSARDRIAGVNLISSVGVQGTADLKSNMMRSVPDKLQNPLINTISREAAMTPVRMIGAIQGTLQNFQPQMARSLDYFTIKNMWRYGVYNTGLPEPEEFERNIRASMKQVNRDDILTALKDFNITSEDALTKGSGRIEGIKVPVLWMHGAEDKVIPVEDAIKSIPYFPGPADLKVFRNGGHSLMTDDLETFCLMVRDFAKGVLSVE